MTRDEELEAIWMRTDEQVHIIRVGLAQVIGASPYPKLFAAQAMTLVLISLAAGLRIAADGSDGDVAIAPTSLTGFEAIPDLVATLRHAADIFHEVHEKAKS